MKVRLMRYSGKTRKGSCSLRAGLVEATKAAGRTLSGDIDPEPAIASRKQTQKSFEREFQVRSFSYPS
jgi:hypothetical protein